MEELSPFHHVMPALHRADQRLWVLFTALSCYLQSLVLGLCFADFLQSPFGNGTQPPPPPPQPPTSSPPPISLHSLCLRPPAKPPPSCEFCTHQPSLSLRRHVVCGNTVQTSIQIHAKELLCQSMGMSHASTILRSY